jgi:predicted RNA-binding protein associated with RNAse of E/G family
VVYHIRLQRNAIRHGSTHRSNEQILNDVIWDIKHRVNCKGRFKLSASNVVLCENWGIGLDILHG